MSDLRYPDPFTHILAPGLTLEEEGAIHRTGAVTNGVQCGILSMGQFPVRRLHQPRHIGQDVSRASLASKRWERRG